MNDRSPSVAEAERFQRLPPKERRRRRMEAIPTLALHGNSMREGWHYTAGISLPHFWSDDQPRLEVIWNPEFGRPVPVLTLDEKEAAEFARWIQRTLRELKVAKQEVPQ